MKVIGTYKHLRWTKKAIQRPEVVDKKATRKTAKKAAEAAISKVNF